MAQAVVALGGNVGHVAATFLRALEEMEQSGLVVLAVSGLYGSVPWPSGVAEQPPYTNAVVHVRTPFGAYATLRRLKRIERRLGRTPTRVRNAKRIIDLDLIALGSTRMRSKRLTLPHPRAHLRAFVVAPMQCVAPSFRIGSKDLLPARSWQNDDVYGPSGLLWWRLAWPAKCPTS